MDISSKVNHSKQGYFSVFIPQTTEKLNKVKATGDTINSYCPPLVIHSIPTALL